MAPVPLSPCRLAVLSARGESAAQTRDLSSLQGCSCSETSGVLCRTQQGKNILEPARCTWIPAREQHRALCHEGFQEMADDGLSSFFWGLSIRCSLGLYPHGEAILLGLAHPSICGWPWLPSAAAERHGRRQLLSRASCLSLSYPSSVPPLRKHTVIPRARGTKGPFGFLFFPNLPHCFVLFCFSPNTLFSKAGGVF